MNKAARSPCWSVIVETFLLGIGLWTTSLTRAATLYVWLDSPNPVTPFAAWGTAATNIQQAVDTAAPGDDIVVTNGIYTTGGHPVGTNVLVNRVAVDKTIALRSLNGPEFTTIRGYQVPGTTNGDGAIRCVYLANGASLSGFTLNNGATRGAGDWYSEQDGGGVWCESETAVVSNCVIAGNSAFGSGGGAYSGTLDNCTLTGNSAGHWGGGVAKTTLSNCTLRSNSASAGGGAWNGILNNCILTGNWATYSGGGMYADFFEARLTNCTLTGNSATLGGGVEVGDFGSVHANNCIIYFNTATEGDGNWSGRSRNNSLNFCCTTPRPELWRGIGNITLDPQLASATYLSADSPCRGAGSAAYTTGLDIDGEAWASPPSIGCDEYRAGAVTGPLSVSIGAGLNDVTAGYPVELTALIEGRATASVWEFRDSVVVSNRPFTTHAWAAPADYLVTVRAFNESHPFGVSATLAVHVVPQTTHYVSIGSTNPLRPYDSWATAATNIQDAVDAAPLPGALILVTNGIYATGGRPRDGMTRLVVDKPLIVRSVNGPEFTLIQGQPGTLNFDDTIRCAYLTNGATLSGFTLTNGAASRGGGLLCASEAAVATNCVMVGNSAAGEAGGAYKGTLNNCALTGNSAGSSGGGASFSTLNNCTLTGNSATPGDYGYGYGYGGGAYFSTLNNCTLVGNSAKAGGGAFECVLQGCRLTGNSAVGGGGASEGTLNNCTLTSNSAVYDGGGASGAFLNDCILTMNSAGDRGGGAFSGTLNNCTLVGNSAAGRGGGGFDAWGSGTITNCIVYFNSARTGPNYASGHLPLMHCCTTPLPTNGFGNITNAPLFLNDAGGNLRLQSSSPCINAGLNAYVPDATDLDGFPRIVSGTVDIGAYEFQGPGSVISYAWLQHYGLPTDGSADATDPDADGLNTWQEWRCLTDPTNALSALRLLSASRDGTNVTVSWQSVAGMNYFLEHSTNLAASPPFTPLASTGIPGQPGMTRFMDSNAASLPPRFYRVGVSP
jgi:hypothetical protein